MVDSRLGRGKNRIAFGFCTTLGRYLTKVPTKQTVFLPKRRRKLRIRQQCLVRERAEERNECGLVVGAEVEL